MSSIIVPIVIGLSIGVGFVIVIMAMSNNFYPRPPNLVLVVNGTQYYGEKGTHCWDRGGRGGCAVSYFRVPEEIISVNSGSAVFLKTTAYRQPTQLYSVTAYPLGSLDGKEIVSKQNSTTFVIDLPKGGDYVLTVRVRWISETLQQDAGYYYHLKVV